MTPRSTRNIRRWCTVVLCSALFATVGFANAAGATTSTPIPPHEAPFHGASGALVADPTCPREEGFESDVNNRERISGIVKSRIGPTLLKLDVCRLFSGAMGGIAISGTFTLRTLAGTLRGSVLGTIGFADFDRFNDVRLTVERGSFLLSRVSGTLTFIARDSNAGINGTLTSNLSVTRGWGRWSHTVPVPLT